MKAYFIATYDGPIDEYGLRGDQRVPGFFETLEDAVYIVEHNTCDIHENCYNYAVIEELEDGLYQYCADPLFYKWIDGRYQRIERPKELEQQCGFTIG